LAAKVGQIWAKMINAIFDWANLIRFGQYQNLASRLQILISYSYDLHYGIILWRSTYDYIIKEIETKQNDILFELFVGNVDLNMLHPSTNNRKF